MLDRPLQSQIRGLYMNALQLILMNILKFSMGQGENHYTKASINRIIEILTEFYDIHVKRRWVFFNIAALVKLRLITRKPRYKNDSAGHIHQQSSMISFTYPGIKHLVKMGVTGTRKIKKAMLAHFNRRDGRWPFEHDIDDGKWQLDKASDRERLKRLTEIVFDSI